LVILFATTILFPPCHFKTAKPVILFATTILFPPCHFKTAKPGNYRIKEQVDLDLFTL